ncbi:DinB family protein, partial [bacterium]|nr:DinB family protein [bacterium]
MSDISKLVWLNKGYLDQAIQLIESLDDASYVCTDPQFYSSGIGDHLRHIIEHYQLFLDGVDSDLIDYDARKRDLRLSSDRSFAVSTIQEVQCGLDEISPSANRINIKMMSSPDIDLNVPISESSVSRELLYLQAHTIHHFA